jgi:hypothetical protein
MTNTTEKGKHTQVFKTTVSGIGPWCVEFPDGEIITTRTEERANQIASLFKEYNSTGKHTPGPWRYDKSHNAHPGAHRVLGPDGEVLADYGWFQRFDEAEANARLIAAAPRLLELVKECVDGLNCQPGYVRSLTLQRMQQAIAATEGKV